MSEPLVWLPFDVVELGEVPAGLRYETVPDPSTYAGDNLDEVELFVLPYSFAPKNAEVFSRMPRLRVVQTLSAGVEHLRGRVADGVVLCNGRGIHDTATSELALTLMLAALRGIPNSVRDQGRGEWRQSWRPGLADKRVLILGYGAIGAAIERRLVPFEVEVVRVARTARDGVRGTDELLDLLPDVDVVVVVVPNTPDTAGMVDAEFLSRMREGALLVNVARGSIVDTDALLAELETGRISAALDVTDPEPLPPHHPLWQAPGLLITPHVGGTSDAMWPRAHALVRAQLRRFAAGEPLANQVSGDY